jgi:hypothetical protein
MALRRIRLGWRTQEIASQRRVKAGEPPYAIMPSLERRLTKPPVMTGGLHSSTPMAVGVVKSRA